MNTITFDLDDFKKWLESLSYVDTEDGSVADDGTVSINVALYSNDSRLESNPSKIKGNIIKIKEGDKHDCCFLCIEKVCIGWPNCPYWEPVKPIPIDWNNMF